VNAVSGYFVNESSNIREQDQRGAAPEPAAEDESTSAFWAWFALGVLIFCWIAEASMCAERGF
jgi:hypothetical protein